MKVRILGLILFSVVMMVVAGGCGQSNGNQAVVAPVLEQAKGQLTSGNLEGASQSYSEVLAADPSNAEANFGAALIGAMDAVVKDPETRSLLEKYGINNTPTGLNGLFSSFVGTQEIISTALQPMTAIQTSRTTIVPSDVQTYLKNVIIPRLDTALSRLAVVEQHPDFTFTVTRAMSGARSDVELDLGEIYALDTYLSFVNGTLHALVAYNWDYAGTGNPFEDASYPNFGQLNSDGAAHMELAGQAYLRAVVKSMDGINFIAAEPDSHIDNGLKISPVSAKNNAIDVLAKFKDSLEGIDTNFPITAAKSIKLNLKNYYATPVASWKDFYFAAFINKRSLTAADFPAGYDFTLSGLFPELDSYEDWNSFILTK